MYGMAYISTVVEANEKAVKELSNEEGFDMGKVMSISDDARKMGLTEAVFKKAAVL